MLVNLYLVGDYGILILIGVVIGAIWLSYYLKSGMDRAQEAGAVQARGVVACPSAGVLRCLFTQVRIRVFLRSSPSPGPTSRGVVDPVRVPAGIIQR